MILLALPEGGVSRRLARMAAHRSRLAILGALLALLAVLGMSALSTWHSADFHDHDPARVASTAQAHDDDSPTDPDHAIHAAAHLVGHGVALPMEVTSLAHSGSTDPRWIVDRAGLLPGLDPASLLRPPRA